VKFSLINRVVDNWSRLSAPCAGTINTFGEHVYAETVD